MQQTGIVGDAALWAEKDKDAVLNYTLELAGQLSDTDTLVSCSFAVGGALPGASGGLPVVSGHVIAGTRITLALTGGAPGVWFNVVASYRTAAGLGDDVTLRLFIKTDAELESLLGSVLFPNRYSAVLRLSRDRLPMAVRGVLAGTLNDDYLWLKLQAAEAEVARKLGILLTPTEVFSVTPPTPDQVAALGGRPWIVEPGYDLPPDFFQAGNFGFLRLSRPLVSKVSAMSLIHPSLGFESFRIPPEWILLVSQQGIINVLPGASGALQNLPVSLYTLQAMGAGYTIPQMLRVQYTAGLTPQHEFYAEVVDAAQRAAVVSVLTDAMVAQSSSISADGLSRSISQDVSKHQDALDAKLAGLRDRIVGPVWSVL